MPPGVRRPDEAIAALAKSQTLQAAQVEGARAARGRCQPPSCNMPGIDPVATAATAANGILGSLTGLISRFIPDKEKAEKAARAIEVELLKQQGEENAGQIEINKVEAASTSLFVSGWRPFIGWVCGAGFAWAAVLQPLVGMILSYCKAGYTPPAIQTDVLMSTMFGMLGLGAMHSFDK